MERDLSLMPHGSLKPGEGAEDLKRKRVSAVRSATVKQQPALLLEPAGYPTGGIHGGHLAVIWNQEGNAYALSMHFAEDNRWSADEREQVLLEAASAMSRFDATPTR